MPIGICRVGELVNVRKKSPYFWKKDEEKNCFLNKLLFLEFRNKILQIPTHFASSSGVFERHSEMRLSTKVNKHPSTRGAHSAAPSSVLEPSIWHWAANREQPLGPQNRNT